MKIEIDLNDIFHDEEGHPEETMQDSIRRQVVESIAATTRAAVKKEIDAEVSRVISEELQTAIKDQMPGIVADLMTAEYTPVNQYGSKQAPTTFREEMLKNIQSQMVYKSTGYSSDKNAFTKAVDALVEDKLKEFREMFTRTVDTKFVGDAMDFATKKFAERLKIPA